VFDNLGAQNLVFSMNKISGDFEVFSSDNFRCTKLWQLQGPNSGNFKQALELHEVLISGRLLALLDFKSTHCFDQKLQRTKCLNWEPSRCSIRNFKSLKVRKLECVRIGA